MRQHITDVLIRAVVTFLEVFLPAWAATNYSLSKVALMGAAGSTLSIVWNISIKLEAARLNNTTESPVPAK